MDDCIIYIVDQCNSGNLSWVKLTLLFCSVSGTSTGIMGGVTLLIAGTGQTKISLDASVHATPPILGCHHSLGPWVNSDLQTFRVTRKVCRSFLQ